MNSYAKAFQNAMNYIDQLPNSLVIGQSVLYPGTSMSGTLSGVRKSKIIEFPVEEDLQLGVSIGLAISGFIPLSIFPRWNFLVLATNQLVNHLDKLKDFYEFENPPKVVIRTGIGSISPMHPGPQHVGDFTDAFKMLCPNINFVKLDNPSVVLSEYQRAFEREDGRSTVLVEFGDLYNE